MELEGVGCQQVLQATTANIPNFQENDRLKRKAGFILETSRIFSAGQVPIKLAVWRGGVQ
jgi:hypothetical protein